MNETEKVLSQGGIVVAGTDTLYGILTQALNKEAVLKIYTLKKRNPKKPFIILISSVEDLSLFNIKPDEFTLKFLKKVWPGKVSVVLPLSQVGSGDDFEYLHRGTQALAFRIPDKKDLLELLKKTGPLVAPSANPEGEKPAETINEAKKYFGNRVSLYVDGGELKGEPSTLVSVEDRKIKILREGAVKL